MRALLQGLCGQRLVVQSGQHHQGDAGRDGVGPPYRSQSVSIGQPQVEQDDVDRMLRQVLLGLSHALHVGQFGCCEPLLVEHLAQQTGVSRVVFDQKNVS